MTTDYPFQNPSLSTEERMTDLLSRLTLPEKINQMLHTNDAIPRLNIPAYNWWNEGCHGVGRNGKATVFPQVIGLAATWNRELIREVSNIVSDEARAKYNAVEPEKRGSIYQGLTFWTPNINIFRDPRWGRGQETFGEDPYLTAELATQYVKGLQGDDPNYLKTTACAKHYAVHSGPEDERHTFDAQPSLKDLYETYLPAFERLVNEGVETVMGAYNRVFGEPACGSKFLLVDILRGAWSFKGHVVSDCGAIDDFHQHHKVTKSAAESAALAVKNGCDLNCGCTYNDLLEAVRSGLITEKDLEISLKRLLSTKFRLGLLDPEDKTPWAGLSTDIVDSPKHRDVSRKAATESIVLLKNSNNTLPLPNDGSSLLVVGPNAANINVLLGNYFGFSPNMVTIAEGVVEKAKVTTRVKYRQGCPLVGKEAPGVNYTFPAAEMSDYVVAVMGLDPSLEGEEGDTVASTVGGDRTEIELPAVQKQFLKELRKHSKKLILVLTGGSAISIPEEHEYCDAVLQVWYPGAEGGRAVADVLFGEISPSGKMPVSVPFSTKDLPAFNDYNMQGRTYRFSEKPFLYPFGFGLSYSKFAYSNLQTDQTHLTCGESLSLSVDVCNEGKFSSYETLQCYLTPPPGSDRPQAVLVAFEKIAFAPGEMKQIHFCIPDKMFLQYNADGEAIYTPGRYILSIGSASPLPGAEVLGAPKPQTTIINLQ
ncbi:MAG: glycoside hydrolase family 3 C-terminal domain-containing protein [Opitutales bacterium]|nr:glycoside hydrolase family 3 C-terminal domain-containing protein [Opitutales bacterium]